MANTSAYEDNSGHQASVEIEFSDEKSATIRVYLFEDNPFYIPIKGEDSVGINFHHLFKLLSENPNITLGVPGKHQKRSKSSNEYASKFVEAILRPTKGYSYYPDPIIIGQYTSDGELTGHSLAIHLPYGDSTNKKFGLRRKSRRVAAWGKMRDGNLKMGKDQRFPGATPCFRIIIQQVSPEINDMTKKVVEDIKNILINTKY